jgi:ABC-type polysaccharide/polyol phosphate export permease
VAVQESSTPSHPPPELLWRPSLALGTSLRELWRDRELVRTLADRDIRASYKQSFLGVGWKVITPLITIAAFTIFFKRIGNVDTGDIPYPVFSVVGLIPWAFFTSSVTGGSGALVGNNSILNKTYCAREVFPIASIVVAAVSSLFSVLAGVVLFVYFGVMPQPTAVWIPLLVVIQLAFTLGVTLALSVLVVYLRDLRQLIGGVLQLGLFLTPVAWPASEIPEEWRPVYAAVNPLVAVIDGYRRTVLDGLSPDWGLTVPAMITSSIALVAGYVLFRRLEGGIADVA